ncbi:MAG: tRNA lysidine(34) synthetase TilS [Gammaproteobacteria bacterium]
MSEVRDFSPQALLERLPSGERPPRIVVAFSGGLDSVTLLHALVALRDHLPGPVAAVHVDHGLNPRSGHWARHCVEICRALDVHCSVGRVTAAAGPGESPEARAREARYAWLRDQVGPGDWLLTAHHRDDQAETVLLQLMRGAGPAGLAAMPARTRFARAWLLRPLLDFARADLARYARAHRLNWLDDPANAELDFDRNFIRHRLMPVLQDRWPSAAATLARSARHAAEASHLLDTLAETDLRAAGARPGVLPLSGLRELDRARQANLVRYWLRSCGLGVPDERHLRRLLTEMALARADRLPVVAWPGAQVRRYRGELHALAGDPPAVPGGPLSLSVPGKLELPAGLGVLEIARSPAGVLDPERLGTGPLTVSFRRGGERIRPAGGRHHRALRTLFQEWGIVPWMRARMPLIYHGDELVAVADRCVSDNFAAAPGTAGLALEWRDHWPVE